MAAKTKTPEAEKPTARALNVSATQRIAKVWIEGDAEIAVSGGKLAQRIARVACDVLPKEATPIKADAEAVVALVAKNRKWSPASRGVRSSQCMAILGARKRLSPVVDQIAAKYGACHFVDAYNAASAIVKGKDPMKAVAAKRKSRGTDGPADAGAAKKRAAVLLKKARDLPHLPREWKAAIRAACEELGVRG